MIELPSKMTVIATASISVTAIEEPEPCTYLAGVCLFSVELSGEAGLTFSLAASARGKEADLIAWTADRLSQDGVLLGYRLAEESIPLLLDACKAADPEVALQCTNRLAKLASNRAIDLAEAFGGAAAPPIGELLEEKLIACPLLSPLEVYGNWSIDRWEPIEAMLTSLAPAVWSLWLQSQVKEPQDFRFAEECLMRLKRWSAAISGTDPTVSAPLKSA